MHRHSERRQPTMASRQLLYEPASWSQGAKGNRMGRSGTDVALDKLSKGGMSSNGSENNLEKLRAAASPKLGTKEGRKAVKALWTVS